MKLLLCLLLLFPGLTQARFKNNGVPATRLEGAAAALQVFPSPAHGEFTVRLPEAAPHAGLQLELVNVLGRVVWQQALPTAAQVTVPASVLPAGLYWVRLRGPQGYQATQRVVLS